MTAQGTCALRLARPGDEGRIEAFLQEYAETSMFLRSNLASRGLEPSDSRYGTEFFLAEHRGAVRGVIGRSNGGYIVAQMPDPVDLAVVAHRWHGRAVRGASGVPAQVSHVLTGMGLGDASAALDEVEPLYTLDLSTLPDSFPALRAPVPDDAKTLEDWYYHYLCDTGSSAREDAARTDAKARAARAIAEGRVRIMEQAGRPLAMTSFNAEVADMVQVGGVFVPRSLRNRGHGRRVVAAHLAEARAHGVTRAILFAASDMAARAYEGIGFQHIGSYRVVLFDPPATIKGVS